MWTILASHINHRLSFAAEKWVASATTPICPVALQPDAPEAYLLPLAKLLPLFKVFEHAPCSWTKELAVAVAVADIALLWTPVGLSAIVISSLLPCLFLPKQFIFFNFLSYGFYRKMTTRKLGCLLLSKLFVCRSS